MTIRKIDFLAAFIMSATVSSTTEIKLADGEFVSRADAVLGAGILSGADPKNFKGNEKSWCRFFLQSTKTI